LSIFACGIAAAEPVTVDRDSNLMAEPRADAAVVAKLPKGTKVEAIGKNAAWVNVKTAKESGWILSFNVRFGEGTASAGSGAGSGARRFSGQKPQITATIGTRGLDAEDLKRANFDAQQLALLDKYSASKEDGEQAAQANGLVALKLDYLLK